MDESQKHYAESKNPDEKNTCNIISHMSNSQKGKIIVIETTSMSSAMAGQGGD